MSYKMPQTYRSQNVIWFPGGVQDYDRACAAIVKIDGHSSVHLHVFGEDRQFDVANCRHIDDPDAREYDRLESGAWDFNEKDKPRPKRVPKKEEIKSPLHADPKELVKA